MKSNCVKCVPVVSDPIAVPLAAATARLTPPKSAQVRLLRDGTPAQMSGPRRASGGHGGAP